MRKYNDKSNVIGNKIREFRQNKKYSQTEICRKLELLGIAMTKEDLSKIEKNTKIVKDFEVWGIAKALDISLDSLFIELNKEWEEE